MIKQIKLLQVFIAFIMIAGLLSQAALPVQPTQAKVQPQLAELAAGTPEQLVRVIVQKAGTSGRAEDLVERWGGQVLKHIPIINAFAAQLPGKATLKLAKTEAVRWVSLDAPVVSTAKPVPATPEVDNFYLDTLNVHPVWDLGYTGAGVGMAVIDSGISER